MKRIILCLAVFLCLSSTNFISATMAKAISETRKRFQLLTYCEPMFIAVESLNQHALKIGLTMESIQNVVESRIRSARLFDKQASKAYLYVNVHIVGPAYSIDVEFKKMLFDPLSLDTWPATTWHSASTGTHGGNSSYILSSISQHIDRFLVQFLRVNDEACRKKK